MVARRYSRPRRLLVVLLMAATAASALGAALNIVLAPAAGAVLDDALRLPVVDASALASMPDGARVVVQGAISVRSTPLLRGFVAYVRQEGSTLYEMNWGAREQNSAPFVLDAVGGPVRILNSRYTLINPPAVPPDHYFGFQIGDCVAVTGSVARDAQGPALIAERVIAGTWEGYSVGQVAALALPVIAAIALASLLAAVVTR
ncbi:MAG: hypothetical protein HZB53_01245 [Chloroflexi bacterium]|nr:hypothetical protein [Chloroflexota bacterium]